VNGQDSGDDQGQADQRRQVQFLPENDKADDGDQNDAKTGPDCIGNANRHDPQHHGQQIERHAIGHDDQTGRSQPGELLTRLQGRCSNGFGKDGEKQIDIVNGHGFSGRNYVPAPPD